MERDDTIDLDDSAEHSLNDKLKDQMRELVKKYESMQAVESAQNSAGDANVPQISFEIHYRTSEDPQQSNADFFGHRNQPF